MSSIKLYTPLSGYIHVHSKEIAFFLSILQLHLSLPFVPYNLNQYIISIATTIKQKQEDQTPKQMYVT